MKYILFLICTLLFIVVFLAIFLSRKFSGNSNKQDTQLTTLDQWKNENAHSPTVLPYKDLPAFDVKDLTGDQKTKLVNYLKFLYPALNNVTYTADQLYSLYNSLTLYYNMESVQYPIDGVTPGWVQGTDSYTDPGSDYQCAGLIPWIGNREYCEPGWQDKAVKLPIAPLGYFSEFSRVYDELVRSNDTMSTGPVYLPKTSTMAMMGQWAVNYVNEKTPAQDEVILQRSIYDPETLRKAASMDMWNPFLGRGISFLQGATLHRMYWYPNGAPGQIKDPLKDKVLWAVDANSLDSAGADFGMINSKGQKITLEMCLADFNSIIEYTDMQGTFPGLHWVPPCDEIKNRFNVKGSVYSGYKNTKTSNGGNSKSDPDYYYMEFSRTDMGTNFFFTGNWFDVFEGAGLFYKYERSNTAPNKLGMTIKLFNELLQKDPELCRRILGADYIVASDAQSHMPVKYSADDTKGGRFYSNQSGVVQGMCMGSSIPGKTGQIILDAKDKNSGAWLFYEAWHSGSTENLTDMICLGILWILCNSIAHPPENNTTIVNIFGQMNGYSNNTWTFFSEWAAAHSFNIRTPEGLLVACKSFLFCITMCSGYSMAENYILSTWQNSTIFDLYMYSLGTYLDYDLLQLVLDVSENDMWTRESLAIKLPDAWKTVAKQQIKAKGPHGGSWYIFIGCFGTKYTQSNPVLVGRTDGSTENPMPFSRSPPTAGDKWLYPYGNTENAPFGKQVSMNNGYIGAGTSSFITGQTLELVSDFVETLFKYYVDNGIICTRNPFDLLDESGITLNMKTDVSAFTKYPFDRKIDVSQDLTKLIDPVTGKVALNTTLFDKNIPFHRRGERCFGDFCSFYLDNNQTKAWARAANGPGF